MRRRIELADGKATTIHITTHPPALRVVRLTPEAPFEQWCEENGVRDGVSGGFAVKPTYVPLGEVWAEGDRLAHQPFQGPWRARRGAILAAGGELRIAYRDELPDRPDGDLLQAGPLLVRDGRSAIAGVDDPEGFSATSDEFDQDLTATREPRLALALRDGHVLAVAAEGRTDDEAGLTLWELADLLVDLGAQQALNLDGGSAGIVVAGGRRLNTPRDDEGEAMELSSPSVTGIVLGQP